MEETLFGKKCSVQSPRHPVETPSNLGDGFLDMTQIKLIIMPRHKLCESAINHVIFGDPTILPAPKPPAYSQRVSLRV